LRTSVGQQHSARYRALGVSADIVQQGERSVSTIVVLCVRWYLRIKLSFRDLVEIMAVLAW
jgi:hypothetical protein